ncbi:MAG: glycine cleavage system protein H [Chlamydiae bacterium]|nr:glycine cleavage system protein H [Chlamydiota bacterium]
MHFTPSHEWICTTDDIGIVGITIYAQKELGEVVYVELQIVEINEELKEDCRKINQSPERDGWIFKIRLQDPQELRHLMNSTQYQSLVQN